MIYDFKCPKCQLVFEEIYNLSELRFSFPITHCPNCSVIAQRLYYPPAIPQVLHGHFDHGLGRYISGKTERNAAMKELGATEMGNTPLNYSEPKKRLEQERKDKATKEEALKMISQMESK